MAARRKAVIYQPLPQTVEAAGGTIRVVRVRTPIIDSDSGTECIGEFRHETRTIAIAASLRGRQRWHTYYHELTHAAMSDSGLWNRMTEKQVEAVCDAIATARVRERFG